MTDFLGAPLVQYFDSNGDPLNGGKLYTYEPGTTTNKATYPTIADALAATNANANPVVLNSRGEAAVVLRGETKLVLKDSADTTIWTQDNVSATSTVIDANGNELLEFTTTASAVNHIGVANAATGNNPKIICEGEADTGITFTNADDEEILILDSVASSVNELTIASAATANDPTISATGSDANIGINLQAKGTGTYNLKGTADQSALLRLYEDTDNGTNYIELTPPASLTANRQVTFPDAAVNFTTGAFYAYDSAGTSVGNDTLVKVTFDTEVYDLEGWFDSTTNYRYTPQVAGKYLISATSGFNTLNANGITEVAIYKNGTIASTTLTYAEANTYATPSVTTVLDMNGSTDYVEVFIKQNGGATETSVATSSNAFFCGFHIST